MPWLWRLRLSRWDYRQSSRPRRSAQSWDCIGSADVPKASARPVRCRPGWGLGGGKPLITDEQFPRASGSIFDKPRALRLEPLSLLACRLRHLAPWRLRAAVERCTVTVAPLAARAAATPPGLAMTVTGRLTSLPKEAPRLCRGGSRSLTFQAVVHRRDFSIREPPRTRRRVSRWTITKA